MISCAIYCRLSREDEEKQQESESIQNQRAMLVHYAADQGWGIYDVYCDEDYSGADRRRPAFNRMLRDAELRRFQVVLCKTQSRFTRDMELVEKYIHGLFPLWGIRFVAVVDNVDTALKGNKKARQINGLVNEWYLEDLSENIRSVLSHKREAGQYIGSFAAYGYRKDPDDRHRLLVDEPAAAVVQRIYQLCLNGFGKQYIASLLNEEGIPNPTAYKRSLGYGCADRDGATLWNHTTVGRILRNELYTGTLVQGTKRKVSYKSKKLVDVPREEWVRVEHTHEAIVDRETFELVQRILDKRTRSSGSGSAHPLAGRVFCADCGAAMIKVSCCYKGTRRSYLQCKRYANSRKQPLCSRHSIRLDELLEAVEERIRALVKQYYSPALLPPAGPLREQEERITAMKRQVTALTGKIEKRASAIRSLYLDKVDGLITAEQFLELNEAFIREQGQLQRRRAELESAIQKLSAQEGGQKELSVQIAELLALKTVSPELISLLVSRVEIGEKQDGEQRIRIFWTV